MSTKQAFLHPDDIRGRFSQAMSDMYKAEVPQYGTLCQLVAAANDGVTRRGANPACPATAGGAPDRLGVERHGAVRLGTPRELATIARLFAVMGMFPVGYYDLSMAGVPVHATAFRPLTAASLNRNPFRVFTSLLRLELIADVALRDRASEILARREIFTPGCLNAIELAEAQGGLTEGQAQAFVQEALETFRWHAEATVDLQTYKALRSAHALVADIVCFKGPHINHLTPRTLDIDAVQAAMPGVGIRAKDSIEGPPPRAVPILLRQTSFQALDEPIRFQGQYTSEGMHTARFGEVEQRGGALTRKGRDLYDELLAVALTASRGGVPLPQAMAEAFQAFPNDLLTLHTAQFAFFRYHLNNAKLAAEKPRKVGDVDALVREGWLEMELQTYEDFLPVSAAGIFRSNLGDEAQMGYTSRGERSEFETALGSNVRDEFSLYAEVQSASLASCLQQLRDVATEMEAS